MAEDEKVEEPKVNLSKEDIDAINRDIDNVKSKLVSKETQDVISKAKEEAKAEALKEVEIQRKIEELEKEREELAKAKEDQEKLANEELSKLKTKVDELTTSKQTIASEDPFVKKPEMSQEVDKWSDDKVKQIEEESARRLFGEDWDNRG